MGDNGRQPLSRRVPGATEMPKAQVRRRPPKLPDHVVEKLRAEVTAARAKADEHPNAELAEEAEAAPHRPNNTGTLQRPKNMDGPRFPKNVVAPEPAQNGEAPQLPKRVVAQRPRADVDARELPKRNAAQRPRDVEARELLERDAAPRRRAEVTEPEPPKRVAATHAPTEIEALQLDKRVVRSPTGQVPAQVSWHVVPDPAHTPVADSDDNTEPIPVIGPAEPSVAVAEDGSFSGSANAADRQPNNVVWLRKANRRDGGGQRDDATGLDDLDQPDSASMNGRDSAGVAGSATRRELAVVPVRTRSRSRSRSRPGPRPRPSLPDRLAAASSPAPEGPRTMLQALFMETGTFEEVVASARARAGGRQTGLVWRYRMVSLIVTALIVLGLLIFVASR
jgi:hypothetical protein